MTGLFGSLIQSPYKQHSAVLHSRISFAHSFAFVYDDVGQHRARWFYETYRKRFGIESNYRQSHACRIRTSTRSALLRLFYFALSMFLRNLWITFEWEEIFAGGIGKQKTNAYYSFENFRDDIQKNIAEMMILTLDKCNMTLENKRE